MAQGMIKFVRLNLTGAGTQTIEAAVAGQRHVCTAFGFSADAATADPQFESGTTIIAGPFRDTLAYVGSAGTRESPLFECGINEAFEFVTAGVGNVSGFVAYYTTSI